jgi:hypothetical protein
MSLTNLRPYVIQPVDQGRLPFRGPARPTAWRPMRLDLKLEERAPMTNMLWSRRAVAHGIRRRLVPSAFTLCATTRP